MEPSAPHPSDHDAKAERLRLVEDLFEDARSKEGAERDDFIDAATEDLWVRAEVRSLLAFDGEGSPTRGGALTTSFDPEMLIGMTVGGFTILSLLGSGGMGAVYTAQQHSPSRRVAVKVFAANTARNSALKRFRRESEILARLDHPSIARVIAAGVIETKIDGVTRPYFAMELVEGGHAITQWTAQANPTLKQLIEAFAVACEAVGSGHRRGIVHLDLKPANLLIDNDGRLHVIDYGIAKSLDVLEGELAQSSATESTASTVDVHLVGTPQYMSPEQFTNTGSNIDSRSDVYSLGLILYELLTTQLPYETHGHSLVSIARIVSEVPPIAPRRYDATLPRGLSAIALKALEKSPDARYGTASELADDLRRWLLDEPVLATRPSAMTALRHFARKNRVIALCIAASVLVIIASAIASVAFAFSASASAVLATEGTARANMRAASASLAANEPADALVHLKKVPLSARGWEARHLHAKLSNVDLLSPIGMEVLVVEVIEATGEVICGIPQPFLEIVDPTGKHPPEFIDFRSFDSDLNICVTALDASPDGGTIVLVNRGGSMLLWDRATSSLTRIGEAHYAWGAHLGSALCGVRIDGTVDLFTADGASLIASCAGRFETRDVARSADGRLLLIASLDGSVRAMDVDVAKATISERWMVGSRTGGGRSVALSPAGTLAVLAGNTGRVTQFDPATGATLAEEYIPGGTIFELAISPDERTIAASSWTNTVRLIERDTLRVKSVMSGTHLHVWGIAFSADGSRLYGRIAIEMTEPDGSFEPVDHLGAWRIGEANATTDIETGYPFVAVTCHDESKCFTAADEQGVIRSIDPLSKSVTEIARVHGVVRAIAHRDSRIVVGMSDGSVALLTRTSNDTYEERWRVPALDADIFAVNFSPDGALLACGDETYMGALLSAADGAVRWRVVVGEDRYHAGRGDVRAALFLDNGTRVTFMGRDLELTRGVFRTSDGLRLKDGIESAAPAVDGAMVRASDDMIISIGKTGVIETESTDGTQVSRPIGRNGGIICGGRDPSRFFIAARDGATRVVHVDPLEELMRLESPTGTPLAMEFCEETDTLSVITTSGAVRSWHGSLGYAPPLSVRPTLVQSLQGAEGWIKPEVEPVLPADVRPLLTPKSTDR